MIIEEGRNKTKPRRGVTVLPKSNVIPSGFDDDLDNFYNPTICFDRLDTPPSGLKFCKVSGFNFLMVNYR